MLFSEYSLILQKTPLVQYYWNAIIFEFKVPHVSHGTWYFFSWFWSTFIYFWPINILKSFSKLIWEPSKIQFNATFSETLGWWIRLFQWKLLSGWGIVKVFSTCGNKICGAQKGSESILRFKINLLQLNISKRVKKGPCPEFPSPPI